MTKALTEEQWLASTEPYRLFRHLQEHCRIGRAVGSRRRLRLYACACCRVAWHLFSEASREMVEVAERAADGKASRLQLAAVEEKAKATPQWRQESSRVDPVAARVGWYVDLAIASAAASRISPHAVGASANVEMALAASKGPTSQFVWPPESKSGATLLRDIFHNPFRPRPTLDPAWLAWEGGRVPKMAWEIYDDRRWGDLPILADALEEAGCGDAELLGHCRSALPHARGCWALDLLLGVA